MRWYHISLLLCFVGFLKEIRPSESFLTDYLQYPYRNITAEELNRYIFPISTYSNLVISVLILLITDFLRYKPIIMLLGLSGIVAWSLLIWTRSFFAVQMIEVVYALFISCEVAYFAYIYAKVSKEHFSAVSSHTRAALMFGRFLSGFLAQTLMYFKLMDIYTLNFISFAAQIAATSVAIFLPKVEQSIYFYRNDDHLRDQEQRDRSLRGGGVCQQAFTLMWQQLSCAYTNRRVILWSIWYACGLCIYLQFIAYVQQVWIAIDNRPEQMWNGAVDAITTLLSAAIALLASRLHTSIINTRIKVLCALFTMSWCASAAIFLTANAASRFLSYVGYVAFYAFYIFTITVSSAEIAKELPEDSYGLIFGINTFIAYGLQSVLTAIVVSDAFELQLNIFQQMNVYGGFLAFVGFSYFLLIVFSGFLCKCCNTKNNRVTVNERDA